MNMQMCRNGHFYNMDEYTVCPHCKKEAAEGKLGSQVGILTDFSPVGDYMESRVQKRKTQTFQYTCRGGRNINQDRLWYEENENAGIWVVADGLGGHYQSELASEAVVRTVEQLWRQNPDIRYEELLLKCHREIKRVQKEHPEAGNAASTIVLSRRQGGLFSCIHAGDSRLYYFRENKLLFRTKDHSVAQISVTLGDITEKEQNTSPDRNKLYNVLGGEKEPRTDVIEPFAMKQGDAFLLCTDGFWQYITTEEICSDLQGASSAEEWADAMINRITGCLPEEHDNYSLVCGLVLCE